MTAINEQLPPHPLTEKEQVELVRIIEDLDRIVTRASQAQRVGMQAGAHYFARQARAKHLRFFALVDKGKGHPGVANMMVAVNALAKSIAIILGDISPAELAQLKHGINEKRGNNLVQLAGPGDFQNAVRAPRTPR